MVSLLIIGTALIVFISLAMNQRPFSVSTALLPAEHAAAPRSDQAARPLVVAIDTIPAILIGGSVLLMMVVVPEISRATPPSRRRR
jgi:ABC-type phosphate transport system permease subunit